MKLSEAWLRDWVNPDLGVEKLADRLTMAGHEVDGISIEGRGLDGVLVADVLAVEKHPDADRLSVCRVSTGGEPVQVVCGAPNVVAGMKAALATPGLMLPNGVKLRKSKIRGVVSAGMLCSAAELGLGDDADGILALASDAPTGQPLIDYLGLPDAVIDLNLTPNRGDCFSVLGIARDVAALSNEPLQSQPIPSVAATTDATHAVHIELPQGCPSFAGRVVRGIDPAAITPLWMRERLRRSGLRPIHPVVDITNYVMLELGQPLHAYDLSKVQGPICPRLATAGEHVTLLDEKQVELNADTLVIADESGAIGIAGIMGGLTTAVSDQTSDVFLEAAFWPPEYVAGRARSYGLHTDASLRFERGVDPLGQERAVERATALLLAISGGDAGPLVMTTSEAHLPARGRIHLRRNRLATLLGIELADDVVTTVLDRLGMHVEPAPDGWHVVAPSYRFDVELEVDLIEEVARIYGYDAIPEITAVAATPLPVVSEAVVGIEPVAQTLIARDFQEVVTYSFVDAGWNRALTGIDSELKLNNPISSEMSLMRTSLWPGILRAVASNQARQQERVRLFEVGKSFHGKPGAHEEVVCIAGVVTGPALPEQWGAASRPVDFYDLKADVQAVLDLAGDASAIEFEAIEHAALQPGQAARIVRDGARLGLIGKLHPRHASAIDLKRDAFVFELNAAAVLASAPPRARAISVYPSIRRDIAVVVNEKISARALVEACASAAPDLISSVTVFDVYQGTGIEAGLKSVALGLILQETSRTLTDVDADSAMAAAVQKLQDQFAAELRD